MVVPIQCIWFSPLTDDHDECMVSGNATSAYVSATVSASDLVAFLCFDPLSSTAFGATLH